MATFSLPKLRITLASVLIAVLALTLLAAFPVTARADVEAARGCTLTVYRALQVGKQCCR